MGNLKDLITQREEVVARGTELIDSLGDGEMSLEQRQELREHDTQLKDLDEKITEAQQDEDAVASIRSAKEKDEEARTAARPPIYDKAEKNEDKNEEPEVVTPGDAFVRSKEYETWIQRFPDGGPSGVGSFQSDPVPVHGFTAVMGLRTPSEKLGGMRALITSADASAGHLVRPDYRGLLEPGLVRPRVIRDLVTVIPTQSDSIEYVKENSRVSGAAPVAEATALTGTSGTKPEGGLTFALVQDVVRTLAEWVPATKRILQDAAQLRAYIDQYLADDLAEELEDQIIAGSGVGENFTGILNTAGIQTTGPPAGSDTALDVLRRARRLILVNARTRPTAIVIHPEDSEKIDLLKNAQGNYIGAGPFAGGLATPPLWGMTVVESEAIPSGTALVGDFRRAVLYDREQTTISVGTVNDDFIRNIVRVLAELRAGFGVLRPKAFVAADLVV